MYRQLRNIYFYLPWALEFHTNALFVCLTVVNFAPKNNKIFKYINDIVYFAVQATLPAYYINGFLLFHCLLIKILNIRKFETQGCRWRGFKRIKASFVTFRNSGTTFKAPHFYPSSSHFFNKTHAMTSSEIFKKGTFCGAKISQKGRSEAVAYWHLTRILVKGESEN